MFSYTAMLGIRACSWKTREIEGRRCSLPPVLEHIVSAMNYSPISVAALNAATNDTVSPF
jgi:hypothetical protein